MNLRKTRNDTGNPLYPDAIVVDVLEPSNSTNPLWDESLSAEECLRSLEEWISLAQTQDTKVRVKGAGKISQYEQPHSYLHPSDHEPKDVHD